MDNRTRVEEFIRQGRLVFLKTTDGNYVGRIKGLNLNNVVLIPVDILSSSEIQSLEIPIATITEISTIVDGKIAEPSKK
jgi:hypothetical protein